MYDGGAVPIPAGWPAPAHAVRPDPGRRTDGELRGPPRRSSRRRDALVGAVEIAASDHHRGYGRQCVEAVAGRAAQELGQVLQWPGMAESNPDTVEIRVTTPAPWIDLDLDPTTRAASIERALDERAAASGTQLDTGQRAELTVLLERTAADAEAKGAIFASIFSDVMEGRPVSATLIVTLLAGEEGEAAQALPDRAGLVAGLREVLADDAATELLELPAGPAVRARRRIDVPLDPPDGRHFTLESVQYFVPLPGAEHLVLLSFSTPTVAMANAFVELFDAIAGTLSWR